MINVATVWFSGTVAVSLCDHTTVLLYIPFEGDDIGVSIRLWVKPGRVNLGPVTIKLRNASITSTTEQLDD